MTWAKVLQFCLKNWKEILVVVSLLAVSVKTRMDYRALNKAYEISQEETKERMKKVLSEIQSGKFTKEWMDEHKSGQKNFLKMRQDLAKHPIEKVGKELRAMMPWIGKNKLVDKDKN